MSPVYWLGSALLMSLAVQSWILPLSVGMVALTLCMLATLHERGRLPPELLGVAALMNILDRLTNKQQLQTMLAEPKVQTKPRAEFDPVRAKEVMRDGIIGYGPMVDDIVGRVQLAYQKIKRTRPVAVFMLAGPPATGKTQVGHVLSKAIFGNQTAYRLPLNTMGHSTASVLTGASPGHIGSDRSSNLIGYLTTHPASVVIVDEFEKAAPEVRDLFLGAWNEGQFPNHSQGGEVSTRDVIFIVTTNAEQAAIAKLVESFTGRGDVRDELSDRCKDVLKPTFGDAILSRVTCVYPMRPLVGLELAELLLKTAETEIEEFGLQLMHVTPEVLVNYVREATARGADARAMKDKIAAELGPQIAALQSAGHRVVTISERDGQVIVEPYRDPAKASPAKSRAR